MPDLEDPTLQRAIRLIEKLLMPAGQRGVPAKDVLTVGHRAGLTNWQLRTAREYLQVTSEKETHVRHGRWIWRLPPGHTPAVLPKLDTLPVSRPPERNVPPDVGYPRMARQRYWSSCPDCAEPSTVLYRDVELRLRPNGDVYAVGVGATEYRLCKRCRDVRIDQKQSEIARRIELQEIELSRITSCYPDSHEIISIEQAIKALRQQMNEFMEGIQHV